MLMIEKIEISDSNLEKLNRLNLSERDRNCYFDRIKGQKYRVIANKHGISKARAEQIFKSIEISLHNNEFKYAGNLLSTRLRNVLLASDYLSYDNPNFWTSRDKKFTLDIERLKADFKSGKITAHYKDGFAGFGKKCYAELREFLDHQK